MYCDVRSCLDLTVVSCLRAGPLLVGFFDVRLPVSRLVALWLDLLLCVVPLFLSYGIRHLFFLAFLRLCKE